MFKITLPSFFRSKPVAEHPFVPELRPAAAGPKFSFAEPENWAPGSDGLLILMDGEYIGSRRRYGKKEDDFTFVFCPAHGVLPNSPDFKSDAALMEWLAANWRNYTRAKIDEAKRARDTERLDKQLAELNAKIAARNGATQ